MKLYQRLLCVVFACMLLVVPFLNTVYASDVEQVSETETTINSTLVGYYTGLNIFNKDKQNLSSNLIYSFDLPIGDREIMLSSVYNTDGPLQKYLTFPQYSVYNFTTIDGKNANEGFPVTDKIIAEKKGGFVWGITNALDGILYVDSKGEVVFRQLRIKFNPTVFVRLYNINGNYVDIQCNEYNPDKSYKNTFNKSLKNTYYSLSVELSDLPFDVYGFQVFIYESEFPYQTEKPESGTYSAYRRRVALRKDISYMSYRSIASEVNLLDILISNIEHLPDSIGGVITYLFDPTSVPDWDFEHTMETLNDIGNLKFGALWQVSTIILEFCQRVLTSLKESPEQNSIEFPKVNIPLGNGIYLGFGGWEILLKPPGFEVLFEGIWVVSAIIGTLLFIRGLKRRYDKIMGE